MPKKNGRAAILGLMLGLLTAGVFARCLWNGFLRYDDPIYITDNPHVSGGLRLANILWAFHTFRDGNYFPLTWLSHMLDCEVFGLNASGHHAVNVLLHAASAVLLFGFLQKITARQGLSFIAAAIWAVHPQRVESVVWASERKDTLNILLGMSCLLLYARYAARPSKMRYFAVLAVYALSLLAKQTLVSLPLCLLLLDFWPLRRLYADRHWRILIVEKLPFVLIAIAGSIVVLIAQQSNNAIKDADQFPLVVRLANVPLAYVRYLFKTFWPARLAVFYPQYVPSTEWEGFIAALFIIVVTVGVCAARRRRPWLMVGWLWFLVTLVPMIGVVQIGMQSMADRYTYWPAIGLVVAVVWQFGEWFDRLIRAPRLRLTLGCILGGATIAALSAATFIQIGHWHDTATLFEHSDEVTLGGAQQGQATEKLMLGPWVSAARLQRGA